MLCKCGQKYQGWGEKRFNKREDYFAPWGVIEYIMYP